MSSQIALLRASAGRSPLAGALIVVALAAAAAMWLVPVALPDGGVFPAPHQRRAFSCVLLAAAAFVWWAQVGATLRELGQAGLVATVPGFARRVALHIALGVVVFVLLPAVVVAMRDRGAALEVLAASALLSIWGLVAIHPLRVLGVWLLSLIVLTVLGRYFMPSLVYRDLGDERFVYLYDWVVYALFFAALLLEVVLRWGPLLRRWLPLRRGSTADSRAIERRAALLASLVLAAREKPRAREQLVLWGLATPPWGLASWRTWLSWYLVVPGAVLAIAFLARPQWAVAALLFGSIAAMLHGEIALLGGTTGRELCLLLPGAGGRRLGPVLLRRVLVHAALALGLAATSTFALVVTDRIAIAPAALVFGGLFLFASATGFVNGAARGERARLGSVVWPLATVFGMVTVSVALSKLAGVRGGWPLMALVTAVLLVTLLHEARTVARIGAR